MRTLNRPGFAQCVQACETIKDDKSLWLGFYQNLGKLIDKGISLEESLEREKVMLAVWEKSRRIA